MKKLNIKHSLIKTLNAIAAEDNDVQVNLETPNGPVDTSNDATWDGKFTKDNLGQLFGIDPSEAGMQGLWLWLMSFIRNDDQRCLNLLKSGGRIGELVALIRFWMGTGDTHSPTNQAVAWFKLSELFRQLRDELLAAGCWKEIGKYIEKMIEVFGLNSKGVKLLVDALGNATKNISDAIGAALVASGMTDVANAYAGLAAVSASGIGSACSINVSSGGVDWALIGVIVSAVVIGAFFMGPIGGVVAGVLGACGTASADQVRDSVEKAKKLMDRYQTISDSFIQEEQDITEEYIDDVVDPTGLSDSEDFKK